MKKILVSFASSPKWIKYQIHLENTAKKYGIDGHAAFTDKNLNIDFKNKHISILNNNTRGYGYWMWKSLIIKETMDLLNYGDILIYIDSGAEFISDPSFLINKCIQEDIVLFENYPYINKTWTKRDSFIMMDCDSERYYNCKHVDAAFQFYKKTENNINFINEFVKYSEMEGVINDEFNIEKQNLEGFIDHRHDQSILSILAEKYYIPLTKQPAQYGDTNNREYSQVLNHHRGNLIL